MDTPLTMSTSSVQGVQLTALVDLISSSVREVIAAYSAVERHAPSLDSLDEGPLETPATTPPNVTRARQIIEAACAQLCATIAQPGDCTVNVCSLPSRLTAFSLLNWRACRKPSGCAGLPLRRILLSSTLHRAVHRTRLFAGRCKREDI